MPASRSAAVGAFVIGGLLLFAVGLFLIGDRRLLFGDTFHAYAEFSSIAGLANGATVRVAGLNAGEVESISVPGSPSGRFRVRMRIRNDLHPLVRLDSVASIQNDGLVGNKFVQIETGSDSSPAVADQANDPTVRIGLGKDGQQGRTKVVLGHGAGNHPGERLLSQET